MKTTTLLLTVTLLASQVFAARSVQPGDIRHCSYINKSASLNGVHDPGPTVIDFYHQYSPSVMEDQYSIVEDIQVADGQDAYVIPHWEISYAKARSSARSFVLSSGDDYDVGVQVDYSVAHAIDLPTDYCYTRQYYAARAERIFHIDAVGQEYHGEFVLDDATLEVLGIKVPGTIGDAGGSATVNLFLRLEVTSYYGTAWCELRYNWDAELWEVAYVRAWVDSNGNQQFDDCPVSDLYFTPGELQLVVPIQMKAFDGQRDVHGEGPRRRTCMEGPEREHHPAHNGPGDG